MTNHFIKFGLWPLLFGCSINNKNRNIFDDCKCTPLKPLVCDDHYVYDFKKNSLKSAILGESQRSWLISIHTHIY